jgi:hypothetical protein
MVLAPTALTSANCAEQAQIYRDRAIELIWIAQGMKNRAARSVLLQTAADYERAAITADGV